MAKSDLPPVPREQHSQKGPGASKSQADVANADKRARNLEQQGRQGNIWQNTHHQGHQQDR